MLLAWPVQGVIFRFRPPAVPADGPTASGAQHGTDGVRLMPKAAIHPDLESSGPLRRIAPARIVGGKTAALQAR